MGSAEFKINRYYFFLICCIYTSSLSFVVGFLRMPVECRSSNKYPIRFKHSTGPSAETEAPRGGELGVMDARVHDYMLTFRMSSILNMADFVVEEKLGTPMPMHVTVDHLKLVLKVSRSSCYRFTYLVESI